MAAENRSFQIQAVNRRFKPFDNENEKKWNGPFTFVQAADCQPGLSSRWDGKRRLECNPETSMNWDLEINATRKLIEKINKLEPKPKFFVVCGDIVDAFDFEEPYRSAQERDIKNVFNELDPEIPLVCVCGNHDVGDFPTRQSIKRYVDHFGDDYFEFYCSSIHFIVLNSQFYADFSKVADLKDQHEKWLDKILNESQAERIIIFQHIPWFLESPDEEKNYFNVEPELRKSMLEKFHRSGVTKIFCGHFHRNAGGWFKSMEQIVTTAIGLQLGDDQSGARIVKINEDSIEHQFFPTENFPSKF